MLRDHAILTGPRPFDRQATKRIPVPAAWDKEIEDAEIDVLPLIDGDGQGLSGWCTYLREHPQAPELETILGGVNGKTINAGAVWRQGHLLHFGFEESPVELNTNGQALLVNSICYIADFVHDRPLLRTPSVFYSRKRILGRNLISRMASNSDIDVERYVDAFLSPEIAAELRDFSREELQAWYDQAMPYISIDDNGKLTVDRDAEGLKLAISSQEFFDAAILGLAGKNEDAKTIRRLLARYAPEGPNRDDSTAADWSDWLESNREYLFFSDSGSFRWYIDELAKRRGIPSKDLRNEDRATPRPPQTEPLLQKQSEFQPISFEVTTHPAVVQPGETFSLIVQIRIAPGWHIYPSMDQDHVAVPTQLDLQANTSVEPQGEWIADPSVARSIDGSAIYQGNITYRHRLKLTEPNPTAPVILEARLIYQICNEEICSPMQQASLKRELQLR